MIVSGFITWAALNGAHDPDLVGIATVIGAIAAGLFGIVWGNVKEHQSKQFNKGV
jgi:multisubunit Na+/H+ antiporter MnhB subunit